MYSLYQNIARFSESQSKALYFENTSISYRELIKNIKKMANYLQKRNIKKDDVVTVVLPNIPSMVYVFYALDYLGVKQNIIHPLTPMEGIISSMDRVNSKYAVVLCTIYQDNTQTIKESNKTFFFVNPFEDKSLFAKLSVYLKYKKPLETQNVFLLDRFKKESELEIDIIRKPNLDSIYLHSGGTTSEPKVIALSAEAINNLAMKIDDIIKEPAKGNSMLAVIPTFHGFGLGMGIHAPLSNGGSTALMIKFDAKKISSWINQGKVSMIIGVPLLYQKLMKSKEFLSCKLSNLKFCFIGGDNVSPTLIEEFNALMKEKKSSCMLLEGYGLTETVTVSGVNTKEDFKLGSTGKPLTGIEYQIRDEKLNLLKPYEIGEVYIYGDTIMNGYYADKKATKKTLVQFDDKTYVKTGDLGYLDDEGFLFLKGRMKRVFKISGINVYPSEVEKLVEGMEEVFSASLEFFQEDKPHLVLYVIKKRDYLDDDEILSKKILDMLNRKVMKYSLPSRIVYLTNFPKTNVGKIDHKAFVDPLRYK